LYNNNVFTGQRWMSPVKNDFKESLKIYEKLIKNLGCDHVEETTNQYVLVYSGVKDLWVPSVLIKPRRTKDGKVSTLYLSPIASGRGRKGYPEYSIFPNMGITYECLDDVRTLPAEMTDSLQDVLRSLDTYFLDPPHDKQPISDALWKMLFPERSLGKERKWGTERTDPPAGALSLDIPVMNLAEQVLTSPLFPFSASRTF
jgi:hypothetical protein